MDSKSSLRFGFKPCAGFTLVEIAIVLVVVGLLIGSILGPLSNQASSKRVKETEAQLKEIHEALMGFVAINGRLPCPAWTDSNGGEDSVSVGISGCRNRTLMGYVPMVALGLSGPTDTNHLLLDSWGNPIRYAITAVGLFDGTGSWQYTKKSPQLDLRLSTASDKRAALADLRICAASAGCSDTNALSKQVVAVILSEGPLGPNGSADQDENLDTDTDFVYMPAFSQEDFDDIVTWVSSNALMLQLVKSGWVGG